MLQAIIFDFDGVILDTELDRFLELQKELRKYEYRLYKKDFKILFGRKIGEFLKERFPRLPSYISENIIIKRRKNIKKNATRLKLIQGIKELTRYLSNKYILAITTGSQKKVVEKVLKHHSLLKYFSLIVSGEYFKSSKPDPECYILTLKKLKLQLDEVIIIEDSEAGIIAAHNAGCKVFALKNKWNKNQIAKADKIFNSHTDLLKYFKSLS